MNIDFPKIGLRNIKTAVSVFICILIFQILGRDVPFYACIAAVICMGPSVDSSVITGKNRFTGTIVGGFCGIITMFPIQFLPTWFDPIYIGLGVLILIYLCNIAKINGSISIACVVYLSILTNIRTTSTIMYAINRIIDTTIGIVISIFVNKYFDFKFIKEIQSSHED